MCTSTAEMKRLRRHASLVFLKRHRGSKFGHDQKIWQLIDVVFLLYIYKRVTHKSVTFVKLVCSDIHCINIFNTLFKRQRTGHGIFNNNILNTCKPLTVKYKKYYSFRHDLISLNLCEVECKSICLQWPS